MMLLWQSSSQTLLLYFLFLCSLSEGLASSSDQPICEQQGTCSSTKQDEQQHEHSQKNETSSSPTPCSFWYAKGWVMAGKSFAKGESIGFSDVVVPFRHYDDRRVFPKWRRHHYFWYEPNHNNNMIFAPGLHYPLECHSRFWNLQTPNIIDSSLNAPLVTQRAIDKGDPIFLPCRHDDFSAPDKYEDFPEGRVVGVCLDRLQVKQIENNDSGDNSNSFGTFATRSFAKNEMVAFGPLLHLHRSELRNPETKQYEELLKYCFGHEHSPLLLLPAIYGVNSIRQGTANVKMEWDMGDEEPPKLFDATKSITEIKTFGESEHAKLYVKFVALRDLQPGEELFMDYGSAWQQARDSGSVHEKQLPHDLIPSGWLKTEEIEQEYHVVDTTKLRPLEIQPIRLSTGMPLSENGLHRVGLPTGMADYMEQWANDIGITAILESYILGNMTLPIDGQERQRINGATWWVKRFWSEWNADMHYITPDDDDSFVQFMEALSNAGMDDVLASIGKEFGLKTLTCHYPSYIAVSHATFAFMHSDSEIQGSYNMIFPVMQVDDNTELILGTDDLDIHVPYKYERDHACLLGNKGKHGTAPCDYRGKDKMRMVVSVYFGDYQDKKRREFVVKEWEGADPPYPRPWERDWFLDTHQHWHENDPKKHLKIGI